MFNTYDPVDIEFNNAHEYFDKGEIIEAKGEIEISLARQLREEESKIRNGLFSKQDKIAFYKHQIDIYLLYACIEHKLSNPQDAKTYLMKAIAISSDELLEIDRTSLDYLYYGLGVVYFELGQYGKAMEEANKIIENSVDGDYAFDNRNTTLANTFILFGNCYYMQYMESGSSNDELFDLANHCYVTAILPYQIPEKRKESIELAFDHTISEFTLETGIKMYMPTSTLVLMSEYLVQDMTVDEKRAVVSAYTNLSQLWCGFPINFNAAQLYATIAIRIGKELPIGSKVASVLAYSNWFKSTVLATTDPRPYMEYLEDYREEAEAKTREITNIARELNWESPYFASVMLHAGNYFDLLGDAEISIDLYLESEAAFIRFGEYDTAQFFLPTLKQCYRSVHPIDTLLGGFNNWFEDEMSKRIN
jgi:tetratricopeptide (TPR) repeat protein